MKKLYFLLLLLPTFALATDNYNPLLDRFNGDDYSLSSYFEDSDSTSVTEIRLGDFVFPINRSSASVTSSSSTIISTSPIDACNVVLKDGVFDTIIDTQHSSSETINQSFYCSKDFEDYTNKRKEGIDFGITIEGVPLKFGANSDNDNSFKTLRELCKGDYSKVSNEDFKNYASRQASQIILNAWNRCIDSLSNPNLVQLTSTMNGNIIIVTAKFKGVTGLANPIVDDLISIGSVECKPSRMVKGAKIPLEGLTDYCFRKDQGEGAIILRTNLGDYTIQITRDHNGEIVGNYKIKTNVEVKTQVSLGRVTKSFESRASGNCNNGGCTPTPFENSFTTDLPLYFKDVKIDSCRQYPGVPCNYSTSGPYHFELNIEGNDTQRVRAYGINGSLKYNYNITYSAEKWRTDISTQAKFTDSVSIKTGEEFNVVVTDNALIAFNVNNQYGEIDPKSFQTGYGVKKIKQSGNTYTFVTI